MAHSRIRATWSTPSLALHGAIALLVVVAGCDVTSLTGNRADVLPPSDAPVPIADGGRAFFVLHPDVFAEAGWPESYRRYNLFICDPVMQAEDVARIHADIPHSRCLAYTNAQAAARDLYPEPYWQSFSAVFDSSFCIRNLETGNVVRLGQSMASWFVMRQVSADVLVAFHRDVTMAPGWDGLYIDQATHSFPEWKKTRLLEDAPVFDIDDDGVADDFAEIDATWETWKPYYLARLRAELGGNVILLGNADGPLGEPSCNGICIENVGGRFTIAESRSFVLGQRAVAHAPFLGVLWAFNLNTRAACESLAAEIPGVHCGEAELPESDGDVEPVDW